MIRREQSKLICSVQQIQNLGQFPQPSLKTISITLLAHEELHRSELMRLSTAVFFSSRVGCGSWSHLAEPFGPACALALERGIQKQ